MRDIVLGRTGIHAGPTGFGALPMQRIPVDDAVRLVRRAHEGGIVYFDTARGYTDSERKLGIAFAGMRDRVVLATKTFATTVEAFRRDLDESLAQLGTDHVDVYQFHNPPFCPKPGDGSGLYEAMLEARAQGLIRFIGITNHRLAVAREAVESGLYDTVQFPFSYLSDEKDAALVALCDERDVGFVAMKSLAGGFIARSDAAFAYLSRHENVLPIWGIQRENELDEFLAHIAAPPATTPEIEGVIAKDRAELTGEFCRACGYCLPCPAGIEIPTAARMVRLLRRAPTAKFVSAEGRAMMRRIADCTDCGHCREHCPYGLDTPQLLKRNLADYEAFLASSDGRA